MGVVALKSTIFVETLGVLNEGYLDSATSCSDPIKGNGWLCVSYTAMQNIKAISENSFRHGLARRNGAEMLMFTLKQASAA